MLEVQSLRPLGKAAAPAVLVVSVVGDLKMPDCLSTRQVSVVEVRPSSYFFVFVSKISSSALMPAA